MNNVIYNDSKKQLNSISELQKNFYWMMKSAVIMKLFMLYIH